MNQRHLVDALLSVCRVRLQSVSVPGGGFDWHAVVRVYACPLRSLALAANHVVRRSARVSVEAAAADSELDRVAVLHEDVAAVARALAQLKVVIRALGLRGRPVRRRAPRAAALAEVADERA